MERSAARTSRVCVECSPIAPPLQVAESRVCIVSCTYKSYFTRGSGRIFFERSNIEGGSRQMFDSGGFCVRREW